MDFLNAQADPALFGESGSDQYDLTAYNADTFASPEQPTLLTSFDSATVSPSMLFYDSGSSNPPSGTFTEPFFSPDVAGLNDFGGYGHTPLFNVQPTVTPSILSSSTESLKASAEKDGAKAKSKGHVRSGSIQKFKKTRRGKNKDLSYDPNDEASKKRFQNSMAARESRKRKERRLRQFDATVNSMREKLRAFGYDGPEMDGLLDVESDDDDDQEDE